ncbi:hypothetical protein Ava_1082 [Trichormus variabilis ATCC 29413]|uniref:Uncharacterized protein n=2 Tax=Anabaena variabilis TaxID=264691 RepID=Q3ME80_TRIV2|nr:MULTISPECIES: hypothetical protein [Nostocaceae]ABA20706.1 hypothetical protein Ava_1082 [Trichormus variabilis ATCC 29413]MBC1214425.1 hypothetical protein [Trichormus variabilis ARAD]MBC1255321.1 hypothetical protein [Trichormus variabilis V5]MBC1300869.1 hypothetical protein [Trichormus variabilis N2B]MBC1310109.1 hypothetical protein [Trichormus variabilis PNB]
MLDVKNEYLYHLLERIKQRPGMYIGHCSITRLNMLLVGYSQARMELGLPRTKQEKNFDNFQEWIQIKFNINTSQSWDSIILANSTDEKDAFYKFFQLFEQFLHGVTNTANLELTTKSNPDYSNI